MRQEDVSAACGLSAPKCLEALGWVRPSAADCNSCQPSDELIRHQGVSLWMSAAMSRWLEVEVAKIHSTA